MSSFISSFMPLSIIVRVVSQVYEKCIYYAAKKPVLEEETMLCNVILSRYENMRLRIVNGGCDTDVGLKSIEDSLLDVIVYEQQYQDLINSSIDEDDDDDYSGDIITLEKCRDETEILNVSVNLNLSCTEFNNNIISADDDDNDIRVTYEDHHDDDDDIYS
jgi:hypothetical protein